MSADPQPAHTCTLHADICVSLVPQSILPLPLSSYKCSFRYVLFNGSRVSTEVVGGEGWEVVCAPAPAGAHAAAPGPAAAATPAKGAAPKGGGAAAAAAAHAAPAHSAKDLAGKGGMLRHRTSIKGLLMDVAAAQALGESPVVYLFCTLTEESSGGAAAAAAGGAASPPPAAAKGAKAAAAPAAASHGTTRPYFFCVPLDLSPLLLATHPSVCAAHGSREAGEAALEASSPTAAASEAAAGAAAAASSLFSTLGFPEPATPFLPLPALFSFLTFSVTVAEATLPNPAAASSSAATAAAAAAPTPASPAPKGGKPAAAAAAATPAAAHAPPPVIAVTPPTLLSPSVRSAVNPLAITLLSATSMPGAPFLTQHEHCLPAYAQLEFPALHSSSSSSSHQQPQQLVDLPHASPLPPEPSATASSASSLHRDTLEEGYLGLQVAYPAPRLAVTPGLAAGASLRFGVTWVTCVGGAAGQWKELLETQSLSLRVHDRDVRSVRLLAERARVTLHAVQSSSSRGAEKAAEEAAAAAAAEAAAAAAAAAPATGKKDAKGAAGAAAAAAGGAAASTSSPPPPQPPASLAYASLRKLCMPAAWPWPTLPAPRVALYHEMAFGAAAWPKLPSGEPLVSCVPHVEPAGAAAGAAAAAAHPPPAAAKGAAAAAAKTAAPHPTPSATTTSAPPPPFKPTLFDCDSLFIAELVARATQAPHLHSHALAALRLEALLNPALPCPATSKLTIPLLPSQRLSRSVASEPTHLLTREQAALATPSDYGGCGAVVKLLVSLAAPLPPPPPALPWAALDATGGAAAVRALGLAAGGCEVDTHYSASAAAAAAAAAAAMEGSGSSSGGPFERLVVVCEAADDGLVLRLVTAVNAINSRVMATAAAAAAAAAAATTSEGGSAAPSAPVVSLRAFTLTAPLLADLHSGRCNAITGVQVVDGRQRIFLLEGLGGAAGGAEELRRALPPRPDPGSPHWHLLSNPALRFHARLYCPPQQPTTTATATATASGGLVLRDIRLHAPLARVAADPTVYRRDATSLALEQAVCALCTLAHRDAGTLAHAKLLGSQAWPSWGGLSQLERLMGGAVSLQDSYGALHPAAGAGVETQLRLQESAALVQGQRGAACDSSLLLGSTLGRLAATGSSSSSTGPLQLYSAGAGEAAAAAGSTQQQQQQAQAQDHASRTRRRSPSPLSPTATAYLQSLRQPLAVLQAPGAIQRPSSPIDFQARNRAHTAAASATLGTQRAAVLAASGPVAAAAAGLLASTGQTLDTLGRAPPGGAVHMYSSQRLNTGEWARQLQAARLAATPSTTYARSAYKEYGALHLSLDPTPEDRVRAAVAAEKAARVTPRGFVYPTGSSRVEDLVHPKAGSASAFLGDAYAEEAVRAAVGAAATRAAAAAVGERPLYSSNVNPVALGRRGGVTGYEDPLTGSGAFGYLPPPQRSSSSGSGSGSPPGSRGAPPSSPLRSAAEVKASSSAFFKSVFLGGKAAREEAEAAAAAQAAAWRAAVVVGSPHFVYHATKDGTVGERAGSLLRGPPIKPSLATVVAGRPAGQASHPGAGTAVPPLLPAPVSMLALAEAFPGPTPQLSTLLRPLPAVPHEPGSAWGGASLQAARAAFTGGGGRDFVGAAEPDIVGGLAGRVHVPLLQAARRVNAEPGVRNYQYIEAQLRGVNTDARAEAEA